MSLVIKRVEVKAADDIKVVTCLQTSPDCDGGGASLPTTDLDNVKVRTVRFDLLESREHTKQVTALVGMFRNGQLNVVSF